MNSEKNIEIEVRGLVLNEKYDQVQTFLKKNGSFLLHKTRVLIDYSTHLPGQGIKDRTKDIRIRSTNGTPEIIVKIGKWGGTDGRKEISVPFTKGNFDKMVQIFGEIGLVKGTLCVRQTQTFLYKDVEIALVEVPGHSVHFEVEKLVEFENQKEQALKDVEKVCKELGLIIFSDNDYFAFVEKLNNEANEIFEYEKYTEGYFKNRFNI